MLSCIASNPSPRSGRVCEGSTSPASSSVIGPDSALTYTRPDGAFFGPSAIRARSAFLKLGDGGAGGVVASATAPE